MLLEIFGFCALAIFSIIVYAETGKRQELGIIAALFLLILSLIINTDGIQIAAGQTINSTAMFSNVTNLTYTNTTMTSTYSNITLPYVSVLGGFNGLFALTGVLLTIFMVFYYTFKLK